MKVYLAGQIEAIGPEAAREWREAAIRLADTTFTSLELVNPMDYEAEEGPLHDEEIVMMDKFLLSGCDAVLVDGRAPGWGTAHELSLAYSQHKLIVVWGIDRERAPIWLRYHSTHFEGTVAAGLEYLYAADAGGRP